MPTSIQNHLANEISPYLLQHADNPVEWYPWGQEALDKARLENKPILLSIGYSACHWCHVMAHESFADAQTAKIMNELFVNIKVDREERPDLDKIYQTAHYILTQSHGGWPLTIFLTPDDHTPFFSGTYFPPEARHQLPPFKEVLAFVADAYKNKQSDIEQQNKALLNILLHPQPTIAAMRLNDQPIELALQILAGSYDPIHGGFAHAPKFPHPCKLEFLLHHQSPMAISTLDFMAKGGIYDQLGGGFFRYSVDEKWDIPHFEKMLYDNAQLLYLYSKASKQSYHPYFAHIARETADWAINEMQSPEGGFYSSIDADSEGHEGKYYVWQKDEIKKLLTTDEFDIIAPYFDLDQPANFDDAWHLHIGDSIESIAKQKNLPVSLIKSVIETVKTKLLAVRSKRVPPHKDDKILTSWNALMIKAMLTAGHLLNEPRYLNAAERALTFIEQNLWVNQQLLVSHKNGVSHLPAYLDDYAFLLDACLTSLQISWNAERLEFAQQLANTLLTSFYDEKEAGFFFTADHHEKLLYRPKTMMDEVIPAGSSVAIRSFLLLGHLTGEMNYLDVVEKTLLRTWPSLLQFPAEHCSLLLTLQDFLHPPTFVILRGEEELMKIWRDAVEVKDQYIFSIPDDGNPLPGLLDEKKAVAEICAYVCAGVKCEPVIKDFEDFKRIFNT